MTSIKIQKLPQTKKNYLKNFLSYKFESLLHLIHVLFDNHKHGHKEIFEIEALLEEIGYSNLKEIPEHEKEKIIALVRSKLNEWERQKDSEFLSYKLMYAIHSKKVIVLIDDEVIEDFENPISINPNSVISFINKSKIDSVSFTTI